MSPIVEAMLAASAPAYQVFADRVRIAHLDFTEEEQA